MKILTVDDEPSLVDLSRRTLHALGHDVSTALSVDEAITALETHRYDVVITDISLHDQSDGLQLAQLVKKRFTDTRVIVVSGFIQTHDISRSPLGPMLRKPYRIAELKQALTFNSTGDTCGWPITPCTAL